MPTPRTLVAQAVACAVLVSLSGCRSTGPGSKKFEQAVAQAVQLRREHDESAQLHPRSLAKTEQALTAESAWMPAESRAINSVWLGASAAAKGDSAAAVERHDEAMRAMEGNADASASTLGALSGIEPFCGAPFERVANRIDLADALVACGRPRDALIALHGALVLLCKTAADRCIMATQGRELPVDEPFDPAAIPDRWVGAAPMAPFVAVYAAKLALVLEQPVMAKKYLQVAADAVAQNRLAGGSAAPIPSMDELAAKAALVLRSGTGPAFCAIGAKKKFFRQLLPGFVATEQFCVRIDETIAVCGVALGELTAQAQREVDTQQAACSRPSSGNHKVRTVATAVSLVGMAKRDEGMMSNGSAFASGLVGDVDPRAIGAAFAERYYLVLVDVPAGEHQVAFESTGKVVMQWSDGRLSPSGSSLPMKIDGTGSILVGRVIPDHAYVAPNNENVGREPSLSDVFRVHKNR